MPSRRFAVHVTEERQMFWDKRWLLPFCPVGRPGAFLWGVRLTCGEVFALFLLA
jgi:hypothetical protein